MCARRGRDRQHGFYGRSDTPTPTRAVADRRAFWPALRLPRDTPRLVPVRPAGRVTDGGRDEDRLRARSSGTYLAARAGLSMPARSRSPPLDTPNGRAP